MTYNILTPASMRSNYATLTDSLIWTLEGSAGWWPDEVVFLDKSARPVAWLVKALWPILARVPGTRYAADQVPALPGLRMVNIDREQWWDQTGASETGVIDVGRLPAAVIVSLRSVFLLREPPRGADVFSLPTSMDGRKVLIVDEVSVSGDTLRIALGLLARAFPTADLRACHWMTPSMVRDSSGTRVPTDLPIWYRADTPAGRLVGNRLDPDNPPTTWRGVAGGLFLSTRPRIPDARGIRLRSEIKQLAADVRAGRLLARPAAQRPRDQWIDRIANLYGYTNLRAFTAARTTQDED